MNREFPRSSFDWDPSYWIPNQNQQPWAWHVRDQYWNQRTVFSNVGWNARLPLPGGFMGHPSYNSPRPVGRPPRPPPPQQGIVSPRVQSSNSSGQHRGRDLDRNAGKRLLAPGDDPSSKRGEKPVLPPKKRPEFKSPELHRSQHWNGSDEFSSKSAAEKPLDTVQETPDPQPASSTKTGLGSPVPPALSAPAPLESPDVDVCMTERNGNALGLDGYMEKKRLLSKTLLADAEGEPKVTTKKTRLGWGQGLAKYEKQLKQQNGQKLVADGDNETENETLLYTATAPASSYRPTPTPGSNVDLGNNITNTTEMMVSQVPVPASSRGCCPLTGDIGYQGNCSTSLTETVICPAEVTDYFSHKHSLQPDNHRCLVCNVGGSCNPCNNSLSMTETVTCTATVPTSSHGSSPPQANIDDHGNINMSLAETVIFPEVSAFSCSSLPAVGGNSGHCNRISSMNETMVSELASPHRCDPPAGLGKKRMSLTETVNSPPVSAFSHSSNTYPLPDGGGNSDTSNSSMSTTKGMACSASSHGCILPSGANGVHGNRSISSLAEKVVRPPDMPPPSHKCSTPPAVGALGNSSTSLTAVTVVNADNVLASSDGFNLPPDGSNAKSINVQDIPHKLISQPINKIQNSAKMPAIIIRKLQKPREILKKNIVFREPQTNDLEESRFKTWSEEEKETFAEKISTYGMDFTQISSFLSHKTLMDCLEYYSKHYKSECSKESNKCLPTTKQSQEKCENVNDAVPYMSGIATVTATKNYKRRKTVEEDLKKPAKEICHESMTHLQFHSLPDKGHRVESSKEEYERVTGNVLVGEMNSTFQQGMNSPITNSSEAACLTILKTDVTASKNLSENSCSNEEMRIGQEIWSQKERCHLIEAIEMHGMDFSSISDYVGTKTIQQCKNYLSYCKNDLNLGKKHMNSNSNSTVSTNVDSATSIIQSYPKVKENVLQPVTSADHGDGENYQPGGSSGQDSSEIIMSLSESLKLPNVSTEDCQIISGEENPELCAISKECNDYAEHSWKDETETNSNTNVDNNAPSDMENPRSNSNPYTATNGAELSGHHEVVQPLEDSEGLKISSKEKNDKARRDEKIPKHSIDSREGSGIYLGCIVNSQRDKEVGDIIISSPEGRDINVPPMLASDGASKNYNLSSTSCSATFQIVYGKTSHGEVDMDLNIPHDVAPPDLASVAFDHNRAEASMDLHEPRQTTDVSEIIEHESSIRARATHNDMGGDSEAANDVTHVQEIHQSQTTVAETGHHPANQPGCIMLFGQVIYEAPSSSGTTPTSSQGNQCVARSDVPVRAGGGQQNPSGPSMWRSAAVNLGQQVVFSNNMIKLGQQTALSNNTMNLDQQAVLSSNTMNLGQQAVLSNNTMPYSSTNGAAAWRPLQFGRSALVNMSQQRQYVHMMMRYSMMRGGVPYHLRQGSSSSSGLINFSNFNQGQQPWPNNILDTSRVVMSYPCLPGSTQNQAPNTAIMPSGINIEGVSTSNTGFPAARRGRGRGQGRGRATS